MKTAEILDAPAFFVVIIVLALWGGSSMKGHFSDKEVLELKNLMSETNAFYAGQLAEKAATDERLNGRLTEMRQKNENLETRLNQSKIMYVSTLFNIGKTNEAREILAKAVEVSTNKKQFENIIKQVGLPEK